MHVPIAVLWACSCVFNLGGLLHCTLPERQKGGLALISLIELLPRGSSEIRRPRCLLFLKPCHVCNLPYHYDHPGLKKRGLHMYGHVLGVQRRILLSMPPDLPNKSPSRWDKERRWWRNHDPHVTPCLQMPKGSIPVA